MKRWGRVLMKGWGLVFGSWLEPGSWSRPLAGVFERAPETRPGLVVASPGERGQLVTVAVVGAGVGVACVGDWREVWLLDAWRLQEMRFLSAVPDEDEW